MSYLIETTVDIDAAPDAVWDVLTDFPAYGEWSNFTSVDGEAQVGSRLKVRMPGFSFRPTIAVAAPGAQLQWTGTLATPRIFHGVHSFLLSSLPDGRTHVVNREEFSGALVSAVQRFLKPSANNGYTAFNAGLKRQVESRTAQD